MGNVTRGGIALMPTPVKSFDRSLTYGKRQFVVIGLALDFAKKALVARSRMASTSYVVHQPIGIVS